jgi:hypothetical protein
MRNPYETQSVAICAGCGNDIESFDDSLVIHEKGKRVYVHHEFDCLKEAVGAITPEEDAQNHRPLKREMSDDFDQAMKQVDAMNVVLEKCFPGLTGGRAI